MLGEIKLIIRFPSPGWSLFTEFPKYDFIFYFFEFSVNEMRDERIDAHIQNCVTLVDEKQLFPKRGRCHKVQISRNRIHREEKTEPKSEELCKVYRVAL